MNKETNKLYVGQKISHNKLGVGMVIGFSEISGNPIINFINQENNKPLCVHSDKITLLD